MEERLERLETAKKLMDIAAKMREVSGDILSVYESGEISYKDFVELIEHAQGIMYKAQGKAHVMYDEIVLG